MDDLIPMNRNQAEKAPFPPGSLVYVYNNYHSPPLIMRSGEVTQVHLNIANMSTGRTELFFTVRSGQTDITESDTMIVQASRLRFRNGCTVKVQSLEDEKKWIPAVVLGIQDVPVNIQSYPLINQYPYSVQLLH